MAAVLLRMAYNPRCCLVELTATCDHIRKLFVFMVQRSVLQLTVERSAFHAFGKMAPVAGGNHGTLTFMRTRRNNVCSSGNPGEAGLINDAEPSHGSRL